MADLASVMQAKAEAWFKKGARKKAISQSKAIENKMIVEGIVYVADLLDMIRRRLPHGKGLRHGISGILDGLTAKDIITGIDNTDKGLVFHIKFPEDRIRRESLLVRGADVNYRTGEGIDDIIALFAQGYTISVPHTPYGYWESRGVDIHAPKHRNPSTFMASARGEFNSKYNGRARADFDPKYIYINKH